MPVPQHKFPEGNLPLYDKMLCQICEAMSFKPASEFPAGQARMLESYFRGREAYKNFDLMLFYVHHSTVRALLNSCDSGCHCCTLIWHMSFEMHKQSYLELEEGGPIILHTQLANFPTLETWTDDWYPGNGNSMRVTQGGSARGRWGSLIFHQLNRWFYHN